MKKIFKLGIASLACLSLQARAEFRPEIERTNDTTGLRGVSPALNNRNFVFGGLAKSDGDAGAVDSEQTAMSLGGGARFNEQFAMEASVEKTETEYDSISGDVETRGVSANGGFTVNPSLHLGFNFQHAKVEEDLVGFATRLGDFKINTVGVSAAYSLAENIYGVGGINFNKLDVASDDISYKSYSLGVVYSDIKNRKTDATTAELYATFTPKETEDSLTIEKYQIYALNLTKIYNSFEFGTGINYLNYDSDSGIHDSTIIRLNFEYLSSIGIFVKPEIFMHLDNGDTNDETYALSAGYRNEQLNVYLTYSVGETELFPEISLDSDDTSTLALSGSYLF